MPSASKRYSSSALSFAITEKSSSVVVSPLTSRRPAISLRRRRMIFPERVLGSESVKRMSSGLASEPIWVATWARSSSFEFRRDFCPAARVTQRGRRAPVLIQAVGTARRRRLRQLSGGERRRAFSTSAVPMRWPGDVEHVVNATDDPEIAVLVAYRQPSPGETSVSQVSLQYCFLKRSRSP